MKILFIAYYFPPDSSSGSFRPLFFANHLTSMGDRIHVLTAAEEYYLPEQKKDHHLIERLDSAVGISRCSVKRPREALIAFTRHIRLRSKRETVVTLSEITSASLSGKRLSFWQTCKDFVTDILATPDPQIGWVPDCFRQGKKLCKSWRPDIIWATGSPWSSFLAGVLLKKTTGVPLVLDFRDPWGSNPNFCRRNRLLRLLDLRLEKIVAHAADGIISNTEILRENFHVRYSKIEKSRTITITNGFEDYLAVPHQTTPRTLTITHIGELYFSRDPEPLLAAVKFLIEQQAVSTDEIRLNFIGGIEKKTPIINSLLASTELNKVVTITKRLPYNEAQRYAQLADVLLLVQPNFPLQIPRKLYEYMAMRKPMFCVAEHNSATARLITEKHLGVISNNTVSEIATALEQIIFFWRKGTLGISVNESCDEFTNRFLSQKLHAFMADLLTRKKN